jgi:DNA topoisomerase-1
MLSPNRGYCIVEDREIIPTDRGIQLASFLDRSFSNVISLDYTKQLEESLDAIANKKLNKLDFLQDFHRNLENSIADNKETAGSTLQLGEKTCPNCDSAMVIRRSRYGKLFYGCSQYPNCRGIIGID